MPVHNLDKEIKNEFDELVKKYGNVVLMMQPEQSKDKAIVAMECKPITFVSLLEELLTKFLKIAKEENTYDEMKEIIHICIARAEAKTELSEFFKFKKKNDMSEKQDFLEDMLELLKKAIAEDDDED